MAGQLDDTATELSRTVRVVKMDSDLNPTLASELQVGGLPTLVLFDAKGKEMDRVEGALMKAQLVEWVQSRI
jgi:thioredoxin 1